MKLFFLVAISALCSLHSYGQTLSCNVINPFAGNGYGSGTSYGGYAGDGGAAVLAELYYPSGVATDNSGNVYIADAGNNVIRKVSASGIITTIAGNGSAGYSGDSGLATLARLNSPTGVAIDDSGNIYIADENNSVVRRVASSGIITTFAGNGTSGYSGDGGAAVSAELYSPTGIAADTNGNVYITDGSSDAVRKVNALGIITTIAGNGSAGYSGDGDAATLAQLSQPDGVAVDHAGNIYIADGNNNVIRKVNGSGIITTIAGNGYGAGSLVGGGYSGDGGPAISAELNFPLGVAVDQSGNLYIGDYYNNRVRIVNISGIITTLAGNGIPGYSGNGGNADSAALYSPWAIAVNNSGDIYIADQGNQVVRKVSATSVSIAPVTGLSSVCSGSILTLADTISGGIWYSSNSEIATISTTGTVSGTTPGIDTISYTAATSCGTLASTKVIVVDSFQDAGVISGTDTVCLGDSIVLTETVAGGVWTMSNGNCRASATGSIRGMTVGYDTVIYAVSNSCNTATAQKIIQVIDCSIAGVSSTNSLSDIVTFYPNPAENRMVISSSATIHNIAIHNLPGQTVFSGIYNEKEVIIDLRQLSAGIYFVRINDNKFYKIVKQ